MYINVILIFWETTLLLLLLLSKVNKLLKLLHTVGGFGWLAGCACLQQVDLLPERAKTLHIGGLVGREQLVNLAQGVLQLLSAGTLLQETGSSLHPIKQPLWTLILAAS